MINLSSSRDHNNEKTCNVSY